MATIAAKQPSSLMGYTIELVKSAFAGNAQHRAYRSTCQELENLTNRELDDLGVSRAAIAKIAYDAVYGN